MGNGETMGKTRWRRFLVVLVLELAAATITLLALSEGALAASFTVSGSSFKVSASGLRGQGFVLYGSTDRGADAAHPVASVGFRSVVLDDFCQSVLIPKLPVVGDVTLRMTSAGKDGMAATDMVMGAADIVGDLTIVNGQLGVDAARLTSGPPGATGMFGTFGVQAPEARVAAPRLVAWSAAAQTIRLKNLSLSIRAGRNECF